MTENNLAGDALADEAKTIEAATIAVHRQPDPVCGRLYRHRGTGIEAYFVTRRPREGIELYRMENARTEVQFDIEPAAFVCDFQAVRS